MRRFSFAKWAAALYVLMLSAGLAFSQGTAFFYQGRLESGGSPATGLYDFTNALYTASSGGVQVGPTVTLAAVPATNGFFSVLLDFGAVFDGTPYWLQIGVSSNGVGNYIALNPRQELTPSPYAIFAGTSSNVVTGSVVKSLNNLKDNVTLAAGSNVTITPSGNSLTIASVGAGGSGIWSLNGTNTYYNGGNVGIGTTAPTSQLDIFGLQDALRITGYQPVLTMRDTSSGNARGVLQTVGGDVNLFAESYMTSVNPLAFIKLANSGNVGLGSPTPVGKLEVVAQDALRLVGYQPFLTLLDDNAGYARSRIQGVGGDMSLFTESYLNGSNPFSFIKLANSGNVGIASATPVGKLEVVAQDALRLIGFQPFLTLLDSNAGYARSRIQGVNGDIIFEPESVVNGSNPNNAVTIASSGNVSVKNITIRGGADLAEPFEFSAEHIVAGSVVIIDDEHPGKLKLSVRAYDRRVAGIVSGANGVNPGISLYQDGVLEGGQNVALTGRVYVRAEAMRHAIKPGDLLTTSDTPGHSMKVIDHAKAQGAILGKAMSGLKDGKGMVLVLVTLQ